MGLRQTFPVQTNKIFFNGIKTRQGDMSTTALQLVVSASVSCQWSVETATDSLGRKKRGQDPSVDHILRPSRLLLLLATDNSLAPPDNWHWQLTTSQDSMTKLNSVSPTDHIQALYRLLLIRTGQRLQAENALRKTLTESLQNSDGRRDQADFVKFYQTVLKMPATTFEPAETDLAGWPLALHQLAEPERSAITLFYLEVFSPHVLSEVLGLHIDELARIVDGARKTLENQAR